jgi:hypothetical protein
VHDKTDGLHANLEGVYHGVLVRLPASFMQKAGEYRFVIQVWDNHAHLHKDHQVKPALELNAVASTAIQFDLDIADGQNGAIVPDHLEETEGAFTVANLNDTNSDGIPDDKQNPVMGEKDLMKLVVRFGNTGPGGTAILKAIKGANLIRIWEKDDKSGNQISLPYKFPVPANQKIPYRVLGWIEGIQPSNQLQDIVLELEYQGKRDRVAATLIWAERTNFRNSGAQLSQDLDDPTVHQIFQSFGGRLGLIPIFNDRVHNGMEMEFTIRPPGIRPLVDKGRVNFDITRQKQSRGWTDGVQDLDIDFPNGDEIPNDDSSQDDEDNYPTNDHIYSVDFPGFNMPPEVNERVHRMNAYEFVRVRFDGQQFQNQNGVVEGSRCSNKVPWRSRSRARRDPKSGNIQRVNVRPDDNQIEVGGHLPLEPL